MKPVFMVEEPKRGTYSLTATEFLGLAMVVIPALVVLEIFRLVTSPVAKTALHCKALAFALGQMVYWTDAIMILNTLVERCCPHAGG